MKSMSLCLLLSAAVGLSSIQSAFAGPEGVVVLKDKSLASNPDNYGEYSYSFFFQSQARKDYFSDYDVTFSGSTIRTNFIADDFGTIADLGKMSCKDIENKYERTGQYPGKNHSAGYPYKENRAQNPKFWFIYSTAKAALWLNGVSQIDVQPGHCYVVQKMNSDRRVIAVFHVVALDPSKALVIDEIEVFKRQTLTDVRN